MGKAVGFQRFAAMQEKDLARPVLGHRRDGVQGAAGRPEDAALVIDHAVVLDDQAILLQQFLPLGILAGQDVGAGQALLAGTGHEEGAEAADQALVVDVVVLAHVARAGDAVGKIHAGVDGGHQIMAVGPLAKGQGRMLVGRAGIKAKVEQFRVDTQDSQRGLLPGFGLQGKLRIFESLFQGVPAGGFRQGRIGLGAGVRCRGFVRERQGLGGCRRQDFILGGQRGQAGQAGKVELFQFQTQGRRGWNRGKVLFRFGCGRAEDQQAEQQAERAKAAGKKGVLPAAEQSGREGGMAKSGCDRSVHTC